MCFFAIDIYGNKETSSMLPTSAKAPNQKLIFKMGDMRDPTSKTTYWIHRQSCGALVHGFMERECLHVSMGVVALPQTYAFVLMDIQAMIAASPFADINKSTEMSSDVSTEVYVLRKIHVSVFKLHQCYG